MFTAENTAGFTQQQLNAMNAELGSLMAELPADITEDEMIQYEKHFSDRIHNKY